MDMCPFTYLGSKPCGCVVFACVDNPQHPKDTAKDVAEAIRDGLVIERVTTEEARNRFGYCEACKAAKDAPKPKRTGRPTWDELRAQAGKAGPRA